jgi:hypothetical protein
VTNNATLAIDRSCGFDEDSDGILDVNDNCEYTANPGQENAVHPATFLGDHCEDPDSDGDMDIADNCPDTANPFQQNLVHPVTPAGDHCEDPESDGVLDVFDNCPDTANSGQENFDADNKGDACDVDDDNDYFPDLSEERCGSNPFGGASRPERIDGPFESLDDDGDTEVDEPLPFAALNFDCDGDGYRGGAENNAFSYLGLTNGDQKVCQDYDLNFPNPAARIRPSMRWPADLAGVNPGDFSFNKINVQDLGAFTAPVRYLNSNPSPSSPPIRFDLAQGTGGLGFVINVQDMAALSTGASGNPPMFGNTRAFNGPVCPYAP